MLSISRLYGLLPLLALLGCVMGSRFPVATPLTLASGGDAEWASKVFYHSGQISLQFEPGQDDACYFQFGVHFSDREEQRLSHDVDILFSGSTCTNEMAVTAAYQKTSSDKYSQYLDKTFPLAQPHQLDVRWKSRQSIEISINGEPFVDAPFGETFNYIKLVSGAGSVTVLELNHE